MTVHGAVTFDICRLHNSQLGHIPDFDLQPYNCGVLSYWYRATARLHSTIFAVYVKDVEDGCCVRAHHFYDPIETSGAVYAILDLQRPGFSATGVAAVSATELTYDGLWHHVFWTWNSASIPFRIQHRLDGAPATVFPRATDDGQLVAYNIDYSITPHWAVGAEYLGAPYGPYLGDLAEFFFQATNTYIGPDLPFIVGMDSVDPVTGQTIHAGGKGFFNPADRTTVARRGTAMDIGSDGSGAIGSLTLRVPQIYLTGNPTTFPVNLSQPVRHGGVGDPRRRFQPDHGTLAPAGTDPFPMP